jgi:hypothetical protein
MKVSLMCLFETKYDAQNTVVFLDCVPLKTYIQTSILAVFRGMSDTAEVMYGTSLSVTFLKLGYAGFDCIIGS